jgi:hypothetical protein
MRAAVPARSALRDNALIGSSTCVTPQPRQRARRGRHRATASPRPRTARATPNPHRASRPPHPGQHRSPAASRRSTETGWSSTVSTAPPSATHGPPGPCRKDHREGRYMSLTGTVSSPMDARYSPCDTPDPAAPSVPETARSWATSQTLNTPDQRDELTLNAGQPAPEPGQWIKDLAAGHRAFAGTLAERQSLTVPSEDPDYGDLGSVPALARAGQGRHLAAAQTRDPPVPAGPSPCRRPRRRPGGRRLTVPRCILGTGRCPR